MNFRYLLLNSAAACGLALAGAQSASAATVLFSHNGSVDPTTEGWTTSGTSQASAVAAGPDTPAAWRVYEPGGGNSRTYNKTLTSTQLSDALATGWEMNATIRYVPPDPLVATTLSNNAWCTLLIDEGVAGKRDLYGMYFGNDASGNTLVRLYATGDTYTVAPGFHDYSLSYDPATGFASFFIDGVLKTSTYGGTTIDNTGTSRVYWGDNTTTAVTPGRGGDYAHVSFSTGTAAVVPEPSRAVLLGFGLGAALLHRRRMS